MTDVEYATRGRFSRDLIARSEADALAVIAESPSYELWAREPGRPWRVVDTRKQAAR